MFSRSFWFSCLDLEMLSFIGTMMLCVSANGVVEPSVYVCLYKEQHASHPCNLYVSVSHVFYVVSLYEYIYIYICGFCITPLPLFCLSIIYLSYSFSFLSRVGCEQAYRSVSFLFCCYSHSCTIYLSLYLISFSWSDP